MTDLWTIAVIVGLGCVSLVARCFFFISNRPWRLPGWVERGLPYAPIAALAGVVLPEVLIAKGELIHTWQDARLFGALVAAAVYFWRRDVLLTMVLGMAVYLPLYIGLGWH